MQGPEITNIALEKLRAAINLVNTTAPMLPSAIQSGVIKLVREIPIQGPRTSEVDTAFRGLMQAINKKFATVPGFENNVGQSVAAALYQWQAPTRSAAPPQYDGVNAPLDAPTTVASARALPVPPPLQRALPERPPMPPMNAQPARPNRAPPDPKIISETQATELLQNSLNIINQMKMAKKIGMAKGDFTVDGLVKQLISQLNQFTGKSVENSGDPNKREPYARVHMELLTAISKEKEDFYNNMRSMLSRIPSAPRVQAAPANQHYVRLPPEDSPTATAAPIRNGGLPAEKSVASAAPNEKPQYGKASFRPLYDTVPSGPTVPSHYDRAPTLDLGTIAAANAAFKQSWHNPIIPRIESIINTLHKNKVTDETLKLACNGLVNAAKDYKKEASAAPQQAQAANKISADKLENAFTSLMQQAADLPKKQQVVVQTAIAAAANKAMNILEAPAAPTSSNAPPSPRGRGA